MALEPTTVTAGSFTVEQAASQLGLAVSSAPPWYTNQTYTITVSYASNVGVPTYSSAGWSPTIYVQYSNGQSQTISATGAMISGPTGVRGSATASWTPLWNYEASIYAVYGGLSSSTVSGQVYAPTAFSGISVSPTVVNPGGTVTVSALLQYYVDGSWQPLPNATVSYAVVGPSGTVAQGTGTTGSSGEVTLNIQAPAQPGSYTVTLAFSPTSYGGSLGNLLPSSATLAVQVGQEAAAAQGFLSKYGKWILAAVVAAVAGAVIYFERRRRHGS